MNVIITGCAGFIGSHVVEEFLTAGYQVFGIDNLTYAGKNENMSSFITNENFIFEQLDINDTIAIKKIVEEYNIKWIINLAAETHVDNSIKDDEEFIRTNINGTRSLLNVCRYTGIKLLHFSTDEVYGVADEKAFAEDSYLRPSNPYSATKASADHIIESYANTHQTKSIIVRPSNNFGPRQDGEKFLPTIIRRLKLNKKIPVYGSGEQIREWTYVKDTAKATRFILENSSMGETYNISSEFYLRNIDLVKKVCEYVGSDFNECVEFVPDRPGHDFKYSITNGKLNNLGFEIENDFNKSLNETINTQSKIKILLLGGSGSLGKQIGLKLSEKNIDFNAPTREECNIECKDTMEKFIQESNVIIHTAGFVNLLDAEKNPDRCIEVNVLGTYNIIQLCRSYQKRLIYISTDTVFSGDNPPYTTESKLNPKNVYGSTKACGELLVETLDDYLVIRAPFVRDTVFNHPEAFFNQYTSRQYVNEIVDDIIDASITSEIGVKHIVGKHQSILDLARETKKDIKGIEIPEHLKNILPSDLELI